MKDIAPAIAMSILIISVAAVFVLRGPLGRAMADRIAGRHRNAGEDEALRADLEETRQRLAEVEERLDFAERLLAKQRESDRIAPPR
jgi:hypothetical protein